MSHNAKINFLLRLTGILLFIAVFGLSGVGRQFTASAQTQESRAKAANSFTSSTAVQEPIYSSYKGLRIGMTADEARAKLGQASHQLEDMDFYMVSATETAQIFYDTEHKIRAISIDYIGDFGGAPGYKEVVGANVQAKPDGSIYKMVRYEQFGFWVSYNRTASNPAIITVTIQKNR